MGYPSAMIEIERKFLVRSTAWEAPLSSHRIEQGYLFISAERSLRVRRSDDAYNINLKIKTDGLARHEIETGIDAEQGQMMLDQLCIEKAIKKTRHLVPYKGKIWEIDVFDDANTGLIVAEIELSTEDESFALPPWVGPEVTDDPRFLNTSLSKMPFCEWNLSYQALLDKVGGSR